ncbi:MAG: hypothetical protein AAGH79_16795 [Bacteroidota bacterium]
MSCHAAKLEYLQTAKGILAHPFYWSGMVLMGKDQPVAFQEKPSLKTWHLLLGATIPGLIVGFRFVRNKIYTPIEVG